MSKSAASTWQKGGLRYMKLTERVSSYLSPTEVRAFFVAVQSHGGKLRLVNPFTPFQREYVIAVTTDGIVVLRLKRPGVFRASIAATIFSGSFGDADVTWQDGKFVADGGTYQPIAFHSEDAEQVAKLAATG